MSEITYDYITKYLNAIKQEEAPLIRTMRQYATANKVPIIRYEVQQFLEMLIPFAKPMKILEIGTAIGFSSIIMGQNMPEGGTITTIERWENMVDIAKKNIAEASLEHQINIIYGDAVDILGELDEQYDLIFMDAAKGQYIHFLPDCLKLLKPNGLLLSDNVLQDGFVAKSKWSIPRRQRTIHKNMRQYLYTITHHPQLKTSILPVADGLTMSCKLEGE
jgi:predicted O-methyltransferase YrrM